MLESGPFQGLDERLTLQKTAFQICKSINDVTPVTPKSLLCSVILTSRERSLSLDRILTRSDTFGRYAEWSRLPLTVPLGDPFKRSIEQGVRNLARSGFLTADDLVPRGYSCDPRRRMLLNFYKNNAMHCLVMPSILLIGFFSTLAEYGIQSPKEFQKQIYEKILRLRNLLKFEFFFSPTDTFLEEIDENMAYFTETSGASWQQRLAPDLIECLQRKLPDWEHVQMFLRLSAELIESYATALAFLKENIRQLDKKNWQQKMLKFAEQRQALRLIQFSESISVQNYSNALLLFDNLKLLSIGTDPEKTIQFQTWDERMESLHDELYGYLSLMHESPQALMGTVAWVSPQRAIPPK